MPSLSGKMTDRPLVRLLSDILAGGRSGVLKISQGARVRQFFIEKGLVIRYAASNLLPESVTEHLKRQGRFHSDQMRKAATSKETNELLSSALLRLGFLTPEEHQTLVREMIEKVVLGAAGWDAADYEYREGELPFTQPDDAGLPVPVAILGLARHVTDLEALRTATGNPDRKVTLSPSLPMPLEKIPLDPAQGFLVSRADGNLSIREIGIMSPLGQEETDRALSGLILARILSVEGGEETAGRAAAGSPTRSAPERVRVAVRKPASPLAASRRAAGPVEEMLERFAALKGQSFYQVLGVAPAASESEVRHAYYTLAKRLHPDKFADDETKTRAEKLFAAITEAYATLSKTESRHEYDQAGAHQPDRAAEEASSAAASAEVSRRNFLRGKTLFESGELVKALPFFQHAVELGGGAKEEYLRYLAMVQSRNPRLRKEAEVNFLKAIELNPTDAENYAQLGILYKRMGQDSKGDDFLQKALSWDATNATAREALGEDDPKKGMFKGLFRR